MHSVQTSDVVHLKAAMHKDGDDRVWIALILSIDYNNTICFNYALVRSRDYTYPDIWYSHLNEGILERLNSVNVDVYE